MSEPQTETTETTEATGTEANGAEAQAAGGGRTGKVMSEEDKAKRGAKIAAKATVVDYMERNKLPKGFRSRRTTCA